MDVLGRTKYLLIETRGNISHLFIHQTFLQHLLFIRFGGSEMKDGPQDAQRLVAGRDGNTASDEILGKQMLLQECREGS